MFEPSKLADLLEDRATARKVEPAPFSLPSLIAWLETKDPDGEYNYFGCDGTCLLGQYLNHSGIQAVRLGGTYYRTPDGVKHGLPDDLRYIAREAPYTFGAALERARAYQAGLT